MNELEKSIVDGSAWVEFCESLKKAGELVTRPGTPDDPFNRAEGYRYLTRLLRNAIETNIEGHSAAFPRLRSVNDSGVKMGADNPDNYYQSSPIKGAYDYVVRGNRGTVDYLGFGSQKGGYIGGGLEATGYIDARQLDIDADGNFELIISAKKHEGNWLPMAEDSSLLIVRQTFKDRKTEKRAELTIERIGADGEAPPALTAERLAKGLKKSVASVQGISTVFTDWADSLAATVNELPQYDQQFCNDLGGDPNIHYFHSQWRLGPDEALVIDADVIPECQTWNFQLDNYWMESLDYEHHQIHVNAFTASYREDGGVTVVVAHRDPGLPNWINTCEHAMGTMCWRWIGATEHPDLRTRVVKFDELADVVKR